MTTCLVCQALAAADPENLPALVRWQEIQIDRLLRRLARGEGSTTPTPVTPPNRKSNST